MYGVGNHFQINSLRPFPTKHAGISVLNLAGLDPFWIVVTFSRLSWHWTDFPFDANLFGEVCFRSPNLVFFGGFQSGLLSKILF